RPAFFIQSAARKGGVGTVERHEVKALCQHKDVGDEVSAAARIGIVVASRTGVGIRTRDAVEGARENQGGGLVGQGLAGSLRLRPASAILDGPVGVEQLPAVVEQFLD